MVQQWGHDPFELEKDVQWIAVTRVVDAEGNHVEEMSDELNDDAIAQQQKDSDDVDTQRMVLDAGIQFRPSGKIYEFDCKTQELALRTVVVTESEHGLSLGEVVRPSRMVPRTALPPKLFSVLRVAGRHDFRQREKNREMEDEILSFTKEKVKNIDLPMSLVNVEVSHSGKKAVVYFSAEERVDFRDLVKDLIQRFRIRLELRQIGPRDKAKVKGGIGDCGRELCCSSFLRDFAPVSIRMAKDQGLALNPNKISGQCGKLKCCLAYEDEVYHELSRAMPKVGKKVSSSSGVGVVTSRNILKEEITIILDDGARVMLKKGEWQAPSQEALPVRDVSEGDRKHFHESVEEPEEDEDPDSEKPS